MQKQDIKIEKFIKNVGQNIKKIREQKKAKEPNRKEWMTQEWMDDKQEYGIDIKYYQSIEQGRKNITLKTIFKICKKLEAHPVEIFKNIDFKS